LLLQGRFHLETLPLAKLGVTIHVDPLNAIITPRVTADDASGAAPTRTTTSGLSLDTCQSCGSVAVELRVPADTPSVYRCRRCHGQWLVVATLACL
jgi:hypothetical protein